MTASTNASLQLHHQHWGDGPPVLALHGLGLESTSFTGLAEHVVDLGLEMIAVDLPGFGMTPLPDQPLTPAVLAAPVVEYAAQLDTKPVVMGISLGARVALEVALAAPDHVRGAVMVAPPLPQREHRRRLALARLLSPRLAELLPVQLFWPYLKRRADELEQQLTGDEEHDWMLKVSNRAMYYISCPATRRAFISSARELALDPAFGSSGLWTRLDDLAVPAAFVWGDQDRFIGTDAAGFVADIVPSAFQIHVGCAGHFKNGPHFRCMEAAVVEGITSVDAVVHGRRRRVTKRARRHDVPCLVDPEGTTPSEPGAELREVAV